MTTNPKAALPPPVPALIAPIFGGSRPPPPIVQCQPINLPFFLLALADVESGNDPRAVGRNGELGAFQFRETTWHMHTREPFSRAKDPKFAETIAGLHVRMIERALRSIGMPSTAANIALCWNAGIRGAMSGRVSDASIRYARRVSNLYRDLASARRYKYQFNPKPASAAAK